MLYRVGVAKKVLGYTDVDWVRIVVSRKSTSRFSFSLGSATIAWSSKKQPKMALSSIVVPLNTFVSPFKDLYKSAL
mgnify:CR=1 FL=1